MIGLPTPSAFARMSSSLVHHADAHRVDERIALVRRVEHDLAADRRHADAVAVVADAFHDAGEQVAHARVIERAEAQRVEHRDGTRAHGEHVAQNAAHAGRRALVRLDGRRVVVRLDLERDGESVPDAMTPAFSPGPCSTYGAFVGSVLRSGRECLYEQCSLQSALTIPSSVNVGARPSMSTSR